LAYGSFLKNSINPKFDTAIVSAEVVVLSDTIRKYNDSCFFGLTNEGVIALMAKEKFCTHYPYAIYVSKNEESNLLQEIINESPTAIVFDVTGDSFMNVYNRNMARRLPNVHKFILDNYPKKQQIGRYLVVSK
jgi:hypothetical protein